MHGPDASCLEDLERFAAIGVTMKEAAMRCGVSLRHAHTLSQVFGLRWRYDRAKLSFPAMILAVSAMEELGVKGSRLANKIGVHHKVIYRYRDKLKDPDYEPHTFCFAREK